MEYIKQILFDSVSCYHDNKHCEACKTRTVKVIVGGSTIVCSILFGSLTCIGSYVNYYFTGFYDIELTLSLGFGVGALIGSVLGISICVSGGLLQFDEEAVKRAVEQSQRERYGIYLNEVSRYNKQLSEYYSGRSKDYPTRPRL